MACIVGICCEAGGQPIPWEFESLSSYLYMWEKLRASHQARHPHVLPRPCLFLQAMSALSGRGAGPAAALLAKLCLEAENAPAAWRLLRCALPAACAARPETVLEVVNTLFRRRRFKEVRCWLWG